MEKTVLIVDDYPLFREGLNGHSSKKERNALIRNACIDYGSRLKQVSDHLGLHYTTVSKVLKG